MDSGSASLQSSSGGDDQEYDSRVESISSFLNSSTHFASLSNPNPIHPPPPPPTSFFDPSPHHPPLDSSPFSVSHSSLNPLYNNLDPLWSRNLRPDPTYTDFRASTNQSLLGSQSGLNQNPFPGPSTAAARAPTQPDHHQISNVGVVPKNPKKRTRASRRAPTTVLTTDTSNFRQMVQEFTGIPAAPFSAGSSPFSRRLDLFGGGGDGVSAVGVGPLYPLRPSAQKRQLSSQYLTSSPSPSFLNSDNSTTVGTLSNNYQQETTDHGFPKQPQTLLNLQNPLFTFQSLLQQNALPNALTFPPKSDHHQPNPSTNNPLEGQQVNPGVTGFPSSSSTTTRWRDHGGEGENLGGFDENNGSSQNVRGYKLNSSDFQTEKGLENVVNSSRGTDQGNVDSWIGPSD